MGEELLQQDWWVPADDLGRIKVVLSEGFPRDSVTTPFERMKNIVAFSFQHAPQDILESSAIAWPNASMWRRAPYTAQMEVPTLQGDDSESHAHSPRRQSSASGQPMNHFGNFTNATTIIGNRRATHPNCGTVMYPGFRNPDLFTSAPYLDYWNSMGLGMAGNLMRNGITSRIDRISSSDTSMPDYIPVGPGSQILDEQITGNLPHDGEKQTVNLKVPTNTPTAADMGGCEKEALGYPIIMHNTSLPDFANELTNCLLNQPMPIHSQRAGSHVPCADVKSRKENRGQTHAVPASATGNPAAVSHHEHQEMRRVSQQMIIPSGSSLPIGNVDAQNADLDRCDGTAQCSASTMSNKSNVIKMGSTEGGNETTRIMSDKGMKRSRNFTPASSRVKDDEDEPRRASPRIRLTPLVEDDVTSTSVA
ncbi:hypothetical protein EsDP_00005226 [Epichloe bromicola]|uniref:Uncharacterized protein n=1 Tax=Epichloe bromicola TaxID=79588 RepID=A0ABQ0CUG5_9HYPO